MKYFCQIMAVVITFLCNCVYASDSVKRFQDSVAKITTQSTESVAVAVARGDEVFKASSKQAGDETQFYIGSVTKHMTAYMMLVTLHEKYPEASLKELLSKKLNVLFPDSALLKAIGKDWVSEISLLDLLTHRSGLSDYLKDYQGGLAVPGNFDKPVDSIKLLQAISFSPAKLYLYSNSNYILAGRLLEELQHDTFDHIFEKLIKTPAGMQSSFAPVIGNYFALKQLPCFSDLTHNSGLPLGNKQYLFADMTSAVGTGNVISTREDLIKWGNYLFHLAPKVITETMLQNYGADSDGDIINLGLSGQATNHLGDFIGHQGGIDSFSSFFGYAPKNDTLVIILSNNNHDANQLMDSLITWTSEPE